MAIESICYVICLIFIAIVALIFCIENIALIHAYMRLRRSLERRIAEDNAKLNAANSRSFFDFEKENQ